jgi:hypothetical protein
MCLSRDESICRAERQRGRASTLRCMQGRRASIEGCTRGAKNHGTDAPEAFAICSRPRNPANWHEASGLLHTFMQRQAPRAGLLWILRVRSVEAPCELYSIGSQYALREREATS